MASEGRHYQVISVLGRGGFGTVYRAKLTTEGGFSKPVALKVLNSELEGMAEMAMRMRDEARLLGMVNHRAIVEVDALVVLDGKWTVVMEYVEGADIKALVTRGPVPVGPALEISRELGGALDHAYNQPGPDGQPLKLLHRDIKPGNVRVTAAGEVKLLDFGIARADFQAREAKTEALAFGTPDYMAPERLELVDGPEGDIYAVGVLLYEMLTGEHFGRTSPAQERHDAKVMAALDKVWTITGGRSEDLVRFVGAILAYDPAARPTAREVERRCTELWRTLGDVPLRDWAESVLSTLTQNEEEAAPGDLASRKLTENIRSGAIPYPTEKLEAPVNVPPPPPDPGFSQSGISSSGLSQSGLDAPSPSGPPPSSGGRTGLWIALALLGFLVIGGGVGLGGFLLYKQMSKGGGVAENGDPGTGGEGGEGGQAEGGEGGQAEGGEGSEGGEVGSTTTATNDAKTDATTTSTTSTSASDARTDATTTSTSDAKTDATTTATTTATTDNDAKTDATTEATEGDEKDAKTEVKPTTGRVMVGGDAKVRLVRGGKRVQPGSSVPPGTYQIEYQFDGEPLRKGEQIVVKAGGTVSIACSRGTKTCKVRK